MKILLGDFNAKVG